MRCPTCGVECRVDSSTEVLKFICRSKQCPRFGQVVGELAPGEAVQRVSYPVGDEGDGQQKDTCPQ